MTIVTRGVTRKIQVNNSRWEAISSSIDRTKASARHGTRFASRAAIAAANARPSSIHVDASSIPPPPLQNQDSLTNQPNASVPPDLDLNSYLSEVINIEKKCQEAKATRKRRANLMFQKSISIVEWDCLLISSKQFQQFVSSFLPSILMWFCFDVIF